MNPSGRNSVIYYIRVDERLFRLRSIDYLTLIKGEVKLHQFAERKLQIIEVIVPNAGRKTIRSLRGLIHRFGPDGTLDIGEAVGAIDFLLSPKQLPGRGSNVFSLLPRLERKAWDEHHTWAVDQTSIRQVKDDLSKKSVVPTFRIAER
jgi:hypothetical protein